MNFRVNLAVACAAAFSFACAEKPTASIPELEAAMQAPDGVQVVGLYVLQATPIEGSGGKLYSTAVMPVGRDGNPNTNPVGTLQVAGSFGTVTTTGPGGCAGVQALTAGVRITNFSVDPLSKIWVDVITTMGTTGTTACNSDSVLGNGVGLLPGDVTDGAWKYPNLAGSADGVAAGGSALPTTSGLWGFRFNNATTFQFYFRVLAENGAPALQGATTAGPNTPLTWTSTLAANTSIQICAAANNPGYQRNCPVAATVVPVASASGAAPYAFSYSPSGLVDGTTYYYRVGNVYPAPAGASLWFSSWATFTYSSGMPVLTNSPAAVAANAPATLGAAATIDWTMVDDLQPIQYTWAVLCEGTCPGTRPGVLPATILWDAFVSSTIQSGGNTLFALDLLNDVVLTPDALSGIYLDATKTYQLMVFPYDGVSPAPAYGAPHSTGAVNITALTPTYAAVTGVAPDWKLTSANWNATITADPSFATALVDICVPNCTIDPPGAGTSVTPVGGFSVPLTAGSGTLNFKAIAGVGTTVGPLTALVAGNTFEYIVYNPDLYQQYPLAGTLVTVLAGP